MKIHKTIGIALALAAVSAACGCASRDFTQLQPGAGRVRITYNPNAVSGMELVGSGWCSLGAQVADMNQVENYARNFTHRMGGEMAYVSVQRIPQFNQWGSCGTSIHATVEAYRGRGLLELK